jgi:hypothetical protein
MRYIQVTTRYVIPIPAEDQDVIEPLAREGMSIMEGFMLARAANIKEINSDWQLLPKEYRPPQPVQSDELTYERGSVPAKVFTDTPRHRDSELAKRMIEADADFGISLTGDVMGQGAGPPPHPWDQGIRIVPRGHELFGAETVALIDEGMLCGAREGGLICVGVKGHTDNQHMWEPEEEVKQIDEG